MRFESLALCGAMMLCSVAVSQTLPAGLPEATATFTEDFNTGTVDVTRWTNSYVSTANFGIDKPAWVPDAFDFIPGGGLRIRTDNRQSQGHSWTGGALTTYGAFSQTYGYFEIKAQMPRGQGLWPGFWMMPADGSWPPEIDIFEGQENLPSTAYETFWYVDPSTGNKTSQQGVISGADFTAGYHTYGLAWLPGQLIWYIDGVQTYQITSSTIPSKPMYILLDQDIGGWHGTPDSTTPFPAYMNIAYFHAYQFQNMPAGTLPTITFGKTKLSSQTVSPGDVVTINSSVVSGSSSLSAPHVNVEIMDYLDKILYSNVGIGLAPMDANSTLPFTSTYTVPADLPPGIYNVKLQVSATPSSGSTVDPYVAAAARITVAGNPKLNLSSLHFQPASGKPFSGSATIVNSGNGIHLQGNMWQVADYSYTVTPSTVLEFDFSATGAADDYCIGLFPSDDYGFTPAQEYHFQFGGQRPLGLQSFNHYVNGNGPVHYMIPIGNYYTGSFTNIVLLSTNNSSPMADATFSNIRIYEAP